MSTQRTSTTAREAPPPDWWGPLFAARQRRIREMCLRRLRAFGEGDAAAANYFVRGLSAQYDRREIQAALGELIAEGAVRVEERPGTGAHRRRVVDVWYLRGDELPRVLADAGMTLARA